MNAPPPQLLAPRTRVLVVGDASLPEFRDATLAVLGGGDFDFIPNLPEEPIPTPDRTWDVVLLLRSLPVIDPRLAERAQRMAPGAELVQVLGPWCEGEERTGLALEGVERVFWHALEAWWRQRVSSTASECVETNHYAFTIESPDASMTEAIAEALKTYRALPSDQASDLGRHAAVFVGTQLDGREAHRLWRFCHEMRRKEASVVALLDFPRTELVQSAIEIGASQVLGKPLDALRLHRALTESFEVESVQASPATPMLRAA